MLLIVQSAQQQTLVFVQHVLMAQAQQMAFTLLVALLAPQLQLLFACMPQAQPQHALIASQAITHQLVETVQ
jgi:hypothetical protein